MDDRLYDIEQFFKYNLEIKKILYETLPKEEYRYSKETLIEYSDTLFKALNDIKFYMVRMVDMFIGSKESKSYIKNFITAVKNELIKCGYDFNKLKQFYEVFFSNMREELVDKVGSNVSGYSFNGISLTNGKSINELLHIIHQTVVNDEKNYQSLPIITQKTNNGGYPITLYGEEESLSKKIYELFPIELSCGYTDIVSLSDDHILIMVRDIGHALSIEIEKENDKYYVKYFIPKICNVGMVNDLRGVKKVNDESKYTVGIFKSDLEHLPFMLFEFISKVPTDEDMFIEGGKLYNGNAGIQK